jgi:hypothetical protein
MIRVNGNRSCDLRDFRIASRPSRSLRRPALNEALLPLVTHDKPFNVLHQEVKMHRVGRAFHHA